MELWTGPLGRRGGEREGSGAKCGFLWLEYNGAVVGAYSCGAGRQPPAPRHAGTCSRDSALSPAVGGPQRGRAAGLGIVASFTKRPTETPGGEGVPSSVGKPEAVESAGEGVGVLAVAVAEAGRRGSPRGRAAGGAAVVNTGRREDGGPGRRAGWGG